VTLRVAHVVVTDEFAGVERYVSMTAVELARRGVEVSVVGGSGTRMPEVLGQSVKWLPGRTAGEALRSVARLGRQDVCHVHMTLAEATAVAARAVHRAPILSTRHFAAPRGSTLPARALRPVIAKGMVREIATSQFVAQQLERTPERVLSPGVPPASNTWRVGNRNVLLLQRLEPEKDAQTALAAWKEARLWEAGWSLRILGDGTQRVALEAWAASNHIEGVQFAGWVADVDAEFRSAGMLLAPTPAEGFGLGVVEAMAAGLPVVASASGGHLESVGRIPGAPLFPARDAFAAAVMLRSMLDDDLRASLSSAGRNLVAQRFSLSSHVDRLEDEYGAVARPQRRTRVEDDGLTELVVCSLEAWDDVWRRNQFLVDILLRRNPRLRVLFVEPPVDPLFELSRGHRPTSPRFRPVGYDDRLVALRPVKLIPRRVGGSAADRLLCAQVRMAANRWASSRPTLWINDVTYAPLIRATDWPSVYDVTDDWLVAPFSDRELTRLRDLEQIALDDADEITVCSAALADSKGGATRRVHLVPNGVDVEHFRRPHSRPTDLPGSPVAVYVGTLHESRLDSDLILEVARAVPDVTFAFVGPDALEPATRRRLESSANVELLGPRSYEVVPAYLQHADVIVVPHLVNKFTDSLDPIKAYECLAVGKPTITTPIAGFRSLAGDVSVVSRERFAGEVRQATSNPRRCTSAGPLATWEDRAAAFERVLRATSDADL